MIKNPRRKCVLCGQPSYGKTCRKCHSSHSRSPSRRTAMARYTKKRWDEKKLLKQSKTLNTDNPLGNQGEEE